MRLLVRVLLLALPSAAWAQPDQPSAADRDRALNTVAEFARRYLQGLPDFVCLRVTQHFTQAPGASEWKPQVKISNELTFYKQSEHSRLVAVNDAPATKMPRLHGWVGSSGDFGDFLHNLFDARSRATFEWKGVEALRGKQAWIYAYRMASGYMITDCGNVLFVSNCKSHNHPYHGTISVAEGSLSILRLTVEPEGVPGNEESRSIDYDGVTIAGQEYRLPIADTFERVKDKVHFRNESTYRDYRKFTANSEIKVESEDK